jgi:hypothetical protein
MLNLKNKEMLHYEILDKKRIKILPLFKNFKRDFYLAGGTGLALQIGHRDSLDFDLFSSKDFNTKDLFLKIKDVFKEYKIVKTQEEKNTLTVIIDNSIKISFFTYKYKLINKLIKTDYFNLASIEDIGCMKLSAIVSRATNKDYIDIYFILKKIPLNVLLEKSNKKFPDIDESLIVKSLVYFEDVEKSPIRFRNNKNITFSEVKKYIKKNIFNI